jgi:hypothetical protein
MNSPDVTEIMRCVRNLPLMRELRNSLQNSFSGKMRRRDLLVDLDAG